jgi:hypothetical protein
MRFSPDGRYALNSDTLGFNAMDAWWLTNDTVMTYRYDEAVPVAAYTCKFPEMAWKFLNNYQADHRIRMCAMGTGEWLVEFADDAPKPGCFDSLGAFWPHVTYGVMTLGDQRERVFIRKPDFAAIIISLDGVERYIDAPNWGSGPTTMRQGHLMWDSTSGPRSLFGALVGPPGAMQTFNIGPDGQKWCVGYVGGWGLSVWKWGSMHGYNLSQDPFDFYPDIYVDAVDRMRVGSSMTQGDTRLRIYTLDIAVMKYQDPQGVTHDLVEVDLSQEPVQPPIVPPIIKPPDPPIIPPVKPPIIPPVKPPIKPIVPPVVRPPEVKPRTAVLASRFFMKGR